MFQVSAEKKYNNQSELVDDMLDNVFTCMQELEVNTGNNYYDIIMLLFLFFMSRKCLKYIDRKPTRLNNYKTVILYYLFTDR